MSTHRIILLENQLKTLKEMVKIKIRDYKLEKTKARIFEHEQYYEAMKNNIEHLEGILEALNNEW